MSEPSPVPARGKLRRARAKLGELSARRVADGGERGWSRWLVPALVAAVVLLGAWAVRDSARTADAALDASSEAQDFAGAVDDAGSARVAATAGRGGRPNTAALVGLERARRALRSAAARLRAADSDQLAAAEFDPEVNVADAALAALVARLEADDSGGARRVSRLDAAPALATLTQAAGTAVERYSTASRESQAEARRRSTWALSGGLVLVALLMWSFWAARSRAESERRERRFQALLQNSSDLVLVVDPAGVIRYVTPVVERMLGRRANDLVGADLVEIAEPADADSVLERLRDAAASPGRSVEQAWRAAHADGKSVEVESVFLNLCDDPSVRGIVVTVRDVGERKDLEVALHRRAFYDSLTDLPNRELFEDRVRHAMARALREDRHVAVLFVDLDDFKTVNDSLGHAAGDELLRQAARRLYECTRNADTAARLGGDEFAVLAEALPDAAGAGEVAQRVHAALDEPFLIQGNELFVHASIGIATSHDGTGSEELLRNADMAMYAAKAAGKSRSETFRPSMHMAARKRLQLMSDLRRGVENGDFRVKYQPLVNLEDERVLGLEALVRWQHPTLGEIPPDDFIPLAEESGLIVPIGRFVLREACRQAKTWERSPSEDDDIYVSVNLSVRQFRPPGQIARHVRDALAETGLEPSRLMLEVTETVLMHDREAITRELLELKEVGAKIAIDDFGTGYSALSYLRQFPIDTVKMDRSFVHDLARGNGDAALVKSVVDLGEALDMEIIAEGIEHRQQLDSLHGMRCTVGQGYYFARPLDSAAVTELLERRPSTAA